MWLIIVRILYFAVCTGAIATYVSDNSGPPIIANHPITVFVLLLFFTQAVTLIDILIPRKRLETISAVYFGLLIGMLLTYLFIQALGPVIEGSQFRGGVVTITALILPYLCITLLLQTKDDFRFVIPYVEFARELKGGKPLVLDTSALIDGRIADIVETKIVDSRILVPQFLLQEMQEIADSNDKMRRTRGRRGLDVLSKLQNSPNADIRIQETDQNDLKGMLVDQRLVALTKQIGGRLVTNDFNLNKVANVQGVDVVNLNDVANSLKPRYLPGEHITIKVIKDGEAPGQGVGFLDDGTMVVCEQGSRYIGKETDMIVTSVLQNSAGRMIFGRSLNSVPSA